MVQDHMCLKVAPRKRAVGEWGRAGGDGHKGGTVAWKKGYKSVASCLQENLLTGQVKHQVPASRKITDRAAQAHPQVAPSSKDVPRQTALRTICAPAAPEAICTPMSPPKAILKLPEGESS